MSDYLRLLFPEIVYFNNGQWSSGGAVTKMAHVVLISWQVLLNHLKYPVIPKKVTIGKRLAQCLHPALPSGVHLKALEAYDIIFKCIGPQRLAQDLFVYSAGLFPVIAHAAMSVKVGCV